MYNQILTLAYLLASISFIVGLKMLSHPATARKGNAIAALGMLIAILATIFLFKDEKGEALRNHVWIFGALVAGTIVGTMMAKKVKMTAMPEMVSLFNGMGGACAALISVMEYDHVAHADTLPSIGLILVIVAGLIIGTVSFAGSIIAWGKLNGKIKDYTFKGQHILNLLFLLAIIVSSFLFIQRGSVSLDDFHDQRNLLHLVLLFSAAYGILFVMPIGGADMPVVISLLNSFTGVAAACGGFIYDNKAMLTGGILVGAAGTLLTMLMCKAMNRSLQNVLIGAFGAGSKAASGSAKEQGSIKEISLSDAAVCMAYANKVMIVPGYGLAVAQAQHACHELEKFLVEKGVDVKYAIHPVAGRMPGHMNVLLAEADVSYDVLLEMEAANEEFKTADVVIVLGANDVVNPAAKTDPASPIFGMPILEVEYAKTIIVNKRSMKPGYAGIENDLFFQPKTNMLFGDAKKVLQQLIEELKNV